MPDAPDIVLVKIGDLLPDNVVERLTRRGYRITSVTQLSEALPEWANIKNPTLLVDCGPSRLVAERIVKTLIEHRRFLKCPVVVATSDPRFVHRALSRFFSIVLTLSPPLATEDLFHRLETIQRSRLRLGWGDNGDDLVAPEMSDEHAIIAQLEQSGAVEDGAPWSSLTTPTIGRFADTFAEFTDRSIDSAKLDGVVFTSAYTLGDLCDSGFCPLDEVALQMSRHFLDELDRTVRRQVLRTVAVVGTLAEALHCSAAERQQAALGALFYGWAFGTLQPDTLRGDYRFQRHRQLRESFAHGLEESAARVCRELGREDVGAVVRCFSDIVAKRHTSSASVEAMKLATLLYGADLASRTCFVSGWWNPRSAHGLIVRLKEHSVRDLPPIVADALTHLLASAVARYPKSFIVPRLLREDPQLISRARAWREIPLACGEQRVALVDLVAGMRLSRGVETFDGTVLLDSNAVLDDDLIWRLWRLSAVRPINGPVIVNTGEESSSANIDRDDDSLSAEIDAILHLCGARNHSRISDDW